MLKNQYSLVQTGLCSASGNFSIFEGFPQVSQIDSVVNKKQSFPTEINSGQFKQLKNCSILNCCSCRSIKQLTLTLYGQVVSKAHIQGCCNILPCLISKQMIVTTLSEVLIGKIVKQNCFSKKMFTIYDSNEQAKFYITKNECQCSSYIPRTLRCGKFINYEILNMKEQVVGTIVNKLEGCVQSFFTCLDSFEINFPPTTNDKERILLLNSIVYLDISKHQFF